MHSTLDIPSLNNNPSPNQVLIIGGGIVGAALAFHLSTKKTSHHIILIDKSLTTPLGSTAHAPGFVGQLNESPILTRLAQDSVHDYLSIPGGFNTVGGLELTSTPAGLNTLRRRCELANETGLPAQLLTPDEASSLAPDFIDPLSVEGALHFPADGTADANVITSYYLTQARARGVEFVEAVVTGFTTKKGNGDEAQIPKAKIATIRTENGDLNAESSTVILATGIWTSSLLSTDKSPPITTLPIPIVPVAHPYTFTPPRPPRTGKAYPFVRWLDQHIYARDHGAMDGMGSYNHAPLVQEAEHSAVGSWPQGFEAVLAEACSVLKNGSEFQVQAQVQVQGQQRGETMAETKEPFNGIFAVTPDNLPLVGRVPDVEGLWLCAAIWVTTAAGTARLLATEVLGAGEVGDEVLLDALRPGRFEGVQAGELVGRAVERYNDIYNRGILGTR